MEIEGVNPENQPDADFVAPETSERVPLTEGSRADETQPQAANIPANSEAIEELYTGVGEQFGQPGLAALDLIHEVDRPDGPEKTMRALAAVENVPYATLQAIEKTAFMSGANTDFLRWAIRYKHAEETGVPQVHRPEMPHKETKKD